MSDVSAKPAPEPTEETRGFWEGCRAGELRLQHCGACDAVQFPPRRFCAGCLGRDLELRPSSGRGKVRSWSVVRFPLSAAFADEAPYVVALVELDEGPTLMAGIRCSVDEARIGLPVEVEFERRGGDVYVPYFRLAS